jgi:uncharacterized membrane protein YbaN (DUF454 family)
MKKNKYIRFLLVFAGTVSLTLGVLGIFLPLLPTTPFLLLTAALYFRGSPKFYNWLMDHRILGPYIKNFREHRAIPVRVKRGSITLLWLTILTSAWFFSFFVWLKITLVVIAISVTVHILSFKNL